MLGWSMLGRHYGGVGGYCSDGAGSDSHEGSLEEFSVRSDGSFEATGLAEAEGSGDVWCGATVTVAAPASVAGAERIPGDADNVGASEGVNRGSGVVVAPECGQSWTDVGGSDQNKICIIGGDRWVGGYVCA